MPSARPAIRCPRNTCTCAAPSRPGPPAGDADVLSVLDGIVMLGEPGAGALAVIRVIAADAIVFGIQLLGLGLRLKKPSQPGGVPA